MSNSNTLELMFQRCEQYAYAFARGKQGMADLARDLFTTTATSDAIVEADIVPRLYDSVRQRAEVIAAQAGAPLKEQSTKSRTSQVSKLANFHTLGVVARDKNVEVLDAMDAAWRKASAKYTPLVACAVAVKTVIAKNASATLADMIDAIDAALVSEPTLASEAVSKIAAQWDKLVHGTDSEPSEYQPAFAALLRAYPADYAETVSRNLDAIRMVFEAAEKARETELALARAK